MSAHRTFENDVPMENIRHVLSVTTDRHMPKSGRNNFQEHVKRVGKLPFLTWHFQETQRLLKSADLSRIAHLATATVSGLPGSFRLFP